MTLTEKLPKDNFIDLWENGVKGRTLSKLADDKQGGLLGELNNRKLGTAALTSLINRSAGDDRLLSDAQMGRLRAFNDAARHRPKEWAQSLIGAQGLPVEAITKALGDSVTGQIINDRHLSHERIGSLVEWAYEAAGGDLDGMIQKLNEYNNWAGANSAAKYAPPSITAPMILTIVHPQFSLSSIDL